MDPNVMKGWAPAEVVELAKLDESLVAEIDGQLVPTISRSEAEVLGQRYPTMLRDVQQQAGAGVERYPNTKW